MSYLLTFCAGAAVGAGAIYCAYKKGVFKKNESKKIIADLSVKVVEGTLSFNDVVGWFKSQNLNQNKDIPFIALFEPFKEMILGEKLKTKSTFSVPDSLEVTVTQHEDKKARIFIGVYNEEKDEIVSSLVILADAFDEKTSEVLGNESLVILQ